MSQDMVYMELQCLINEKDTQYIVLGTLLGEKKKISSVVTLL
ncbi:hypothetical protein YYU_03675 [Anaplasma phagocytophilum str. HZ2]|uniref:Uncharacterized protein n=2 Tax=Anaplasma phagocytophilum TaxID=948 RepID=Q2GJT7_ANAPZ|nr:hypothetical protein APH_0787 [Anaplasma phagocytophilum str. HZ]AGR79476.1 hypothetical protein YYU_03675 [Anaplasma phagocytophilum str. HZ2]KJV87049.1 hypothetical protein APHNYW_0793 [Anaplasma phagocytophilum str. ApNYW]